ncbi:TonB-dependent receptor domain-containing protein [Alcanivorax sp. 1008]|uniref:TonB-dependent receptor family protein n=1 Tax=Alcanivorax sp. 1008 TaxID=2816853 RepID=UPI001D7C0034|nr:TonB-dependent receptor [Alcanivorax sp. 1008]MCC1497251.1 TonB-dependent receptor [Alcanivorax sp. 1008]
MNRVVTEGSVFSARRALMVAAVALSCAATAPALAEDEVGGARLPEVIVTGATEQQAARQPGAVAQISREEMDKTQPKSTEEALRSVPGVYIKQEEETAVVVNIGVRGLSSADYKTLVLEDGVPVAPGLFVGNGRYYNPRIQRIDNIEVLKGASSLRYGPSTIGGVINYRTKQPADGVVLESSVGSWDTYKNMVELGGTAPSGDGIFGAVLSTAKSDGFMGKGYDMSDAMIKAGSAIGEDQWVGVKFSHYENDANISYRGLFLDDYKAGKTYNPAPDDWFLTGRTSFDLNHAWDVSATVRVNTLLYWSEMYRDYWRYATDNPASVSAGRWVYTNNLNGNNRAFERKGAETRITVLNQMFGINGEAEVGLRYMVETMHDQTIGATRATPRTGTINRDRVDSADSYAIFAQNRFDMSDRLSVTPGVRVEHYQQSRKDLRVPDSASTSNTEVIPGLGATFQMNSSVQLFGGVYKAFAPALNGDALDGLQDQDLEAERSINVEVGLRGRDGAWSYEMAAFRMDFDNQIIPANSTSVFQNTNGGKTLHQGLEGGVGYQFNGGFSVEANATWVPVAEFVGTRFEPDGITIDIPDGNRVTYAPELVANLVLGYTAGNLRTLLSANYTGSQYTDTDNTKAIQENTSGFFTGQVEAYATADLSARYQATADLELFGSVKNLTDERYIASLRQGIYVGPERSVEAGFRYRF